jgi:hypothetical protein
MRRSMFLFVLYFCLIGGAHAANSYPPFPTIKKFSEVCLNPNFDFSRSPLADPSPDAIRLEDFDAEGFFRGNAPKNYAFWGIPEVAGKTPFLLVSMHENPNGRHGCQFVVGEIDITTFMAEFERVLNVQKLEDRRENLSRLVTYQMVEERGAWAIRVSVYLAPGQDGFQIYSYVMPR